MYISVPTGRTNLAKCQLNIYRQTTHRRVQNLIETLTAQKNLYCSVQTERPQDAMCKIQYLQRDHTQHYVKINSDRQITHSNLYIYIQSDRTHFKIQSSVPTERPQKAIFRVHQVQTNYIQPFVEFSFDRLNTMQYIGFSTERQKEMSNV